jgi:uncharacterized protein
MDRTHALAATATAAIALHVADDSFLQPEPGTSAADHLVSGLVPLAVLVAVAIAAPRLRPGMAAWLRVAVGLLGVVAGSVEAGYHVASGPVAGDDYTGFLALPAGVALVGTGVATLWRTRRRRRPLRRVGIAAVTATIGFFVVVPLLSTYGYTHFGTRSMPPSLGLAHETVTLAACDGVKLAAWYVPSRNGAAVIAFPGRSGPQAHARMLARHGYGVLLLDPRGTGASEGDPFRWNGTRDLEAAIGFLQHRPDVDANRIGGLGLSLGGELLLETAAENAGLKAVVSEGAGIRSLREQMSKPGFQKWLTAPFWASMTGGIAVFSNATPPPNLEQLVQRIAPRSVFLIYAGNPVGGEELNEQFYKAARAPKLLWRIADAGHTQGLATRPREYERRVVGFFDRTLLGGESARRAW